jgi:hypothetical protein
MSFVYPQFLWALGVLAIPIAIHLFNFRRVKKIYFSNVRFLKAVQTQTNALRTLKKILILLCRMAFLTFLVLAFAQPFLSRQNKTNSLEPNGILSVYLDNSYSMQSEFKDKKYLALGKESILELVKVFPKAAQFQLITNNFSNKEQFAKNASKIEDELTETQFSNQFRSLQTVTDRQQSLLKRASQAQKNQVFLFSDFQKTTAGTLEKIRLDSNNRYFIVPMKAEKTPNLAIDSAWLANPFVKELEQNTLNFRLKNYSDEIYNDLIVKFFVEEQQISTATLNVSANGIVSGSFNFTVQGKGAKKCRISLDDSPVTFDNDYFLVLNVAPIIKILNISQNVANIFVQSVYSSENSFRIEDANSSFLKNKTLTDNDLIILNGIETIDATDSEMLVNFIEQGGSIAFFPSERPDIQSYSNFLANMSVRAIEKNISDSLGKNASKTLLPPNINNPFLKGIFDQIPANAYMPYANNVMSWLGAGNQIFVFKNGKPFLTEFKKGRGKLYLFASPLDKRHTDFPSNALFVPVMYKIASLSKQSGEKLSYNFQERTLTLKIKKPEKNTIFKLKKLNSEIIPAQRILGEQLVLELPEQTLESEYYDLLAGTEKIGILAFNYGKEESEMQFYNTSDLKKIFEKSKNVQVYENIAQKNFVNDFKNQNIGISLWKYCIWLALTFLLIEVILIRLMK